MGRLNDLANRFGTDKGDFHHEKHGYADVYEQYLGKWENEPVNYVEIGINDPRFPGASIHMWNQYFTKGIYRGLDINLDAKVTPLILQYPNVYLYNVDQTNESQLVEFANSRPPIDFVVDDGIHTYEAQMTSYRALFPYLKSGGLYFIEDCHAKDCHRTVQWFKEIKEFQEKNGMIGPGIEFYNNDKLIVITKG